MMREQGPCVTGGVPNFGPVEAIAGCVCVAERALRGWPRQHHRSANGRGRHGDSTPFNGTAHSWPRCFRRRLYRLLQQHRLPHHQHHLYRRRITQTQFDDTSFSCNRASDPTVPNPFFLFCPVDYVSGTGLEFIFHGTLPGPGGPDLGIPPGGNFAITFNDNYSLTVDSGGWGSVGNPTFTATNVQIDPASSPEPRSALLVGVTLIAGVSLLSLRRRLKTG